MKKIILFIAMFFIGMICVNASELPKLYFEGDIANMQSKADIRNVSVKYESDTINFNGYAKLKLQGASSLSYDKKNYNITLYQDSAQSSKLKIDFGWGEQSKYCLKANWIDKTHSRNIVTANIAAQIQKKYGLFENAPNYGLIDGFPIEIYINGDFLGLYTLNIPKDNWLFNMDNDNPNNIVFSGEQWTNSVFFKEEATWNNGWELETGEENDETLKKFNRLINFVMNSTDEEFKKNINDYINLDSLLNYYVICEYVDLFDNVAKNILLATYDGNVWYASLYDLDGSWGGMWKDLTLRGYDKITNFNQNQLFARLETNFGTEIADRYFELRKDILTLENVLEKFNSFKNSIPEKTFELEQTRWENIPGHDISQIKDFINVRTPLLDEYFNSFYDIETENKNSNIPILVALISIILTIIGMIIVIKKR